MILQKHLKESCWILIDISHTKTFLRMLLPGDPLRVPLEIAVFGSVWIFTFDNNFGIKKDFAKLFDGEFINIFQILS